MTSCQYFITSPHSAVKNSEIWYSNRILTLDLEAWEIQKSENRSSVLLHLSQSVSLWKDLSRKIHHKEIESILLNTKFLFETSVSYSKFKIFLTWQIRIKFTCFLRKHALWRLFYHWWIFMGEFNILVQKLR